ncbi:nucleotidyl transferase AbiEii/AbiGii toxin family protein [Kitasatospora sp. NPDC052868]|uniref:nucleotidyl transferase AbiEii/AbiGii toxin family protein n=1 Tax=Kitasatospora sp. NPDC052868 TaxID=3364060 RepID=UPI0037C747B4
MGKTYDTPGAFRTALNQAARKAAKEHGLNIAELMAVFYFSRLAARVFTHDPHGWLIKGGQALLVRYAGSARLSRDLDLQSTSADLPVEAALEALVAAAGHQLEDHLRFVARPARLHADPTKGAEQPFDVYLGSTKVHSVKVDVVVGRTVIGTPELRALAPIVGLEWPVEWPQAMLYPVVDHVVDKICAMYEEHPNGPSGRYRDLADLLLMSQQESLDGRTAHDALRREAARRTARGSKVNLPVTFALPDATWNAGYPGAAALVIGLKGCGDIPAATLAAQAFMDPLLADGPLHATWDPAVAAWQPHDG